MIIGLFVLYRAFGTLNIDAILTAAPQAWAVGDPLATLACLLLLGGAVGKSAQLPLQTWLPDAMAGPTPVSALIHAATMVTAGVYLIARMEPLFALSPFALACVGAIGAITLLLAGFTALMQTDIKKILAYSTMSQIGYMFLAEGVGAYDSAMFHLMTHAFFKALLFLSAGSVILAMHHEQDIFKMGGLRTRLPFAFASMLIGTLALTAFPFTSGYYSKDEILHQAYLTRTSRSVARRSARCVPDGALQLPADLRRVLRTGALESRGRRRAACRSWSEPSHSAGGARRIRARRRFDSPAAAAQCCRKRTPSTKRAA